MRNCAPTLLTMKPDIRQQIFDNCVEMDGPIKDSPCLIWQGLTNNKGYGVIGRQLMHRAVDLSPGISSKNE